MEGSRLLAKPAIAAIIAQHQEDTRKRNALDADTIINELSLIGFSDIRNIIRLEDELPKVQSFEKIGEATRTIESIGQTSGGKIKVKLYDKLKALELLGRHIGMFNHLDPNKQSTMGQQTDEPEPDEGPREPEDLLRSIRGKLGKD